MSYGGYFAVGAARVFETELMAPFLLRKSFEAERYSDALNIIMSGPFGRRLNEKERDFGLGGFLKNMAASFADISQRADVFVLDQSKFVRALKVTGEREILNALRGSKDPFEFYGFLYKERQKRLGMIDGGDVLLFVWLSLWWQTRLVRMILSSKKRGVKTKDAG